MNALNRIAVVLVLSAAHSHLGANSSLEPRPVPPEGQFLKSAQVFTAHVVRLEAIEEESLLRITLKVHTVWKGEADPERFLEVRWPTSKSLLVGENYLWLLPPSASRVASLSDWGVFQTTTCGVPSQFEFLHGKPKVVLSLPPPPPPSPMHDPFRRPCP